MRERGAGLLVTTLFGPSLNANTGDWSVGCSGSGSRTARSPIR